MKKDSNIFASKIKSGDIESFELFYNMEFDNIVYFVNSYLHDIYLSEDVAQESLISLWNKRTQIDADKNLRAFLYTIAKNKAINLLKSKLYSCNSVRINEINADLFAINDESMENELNALELKTLIDRTIDNLPSTVKESFVMSRKMGMTNKEISEEKQMSLTGIEYHIKISLKILRLKLKEFFLFF